MHLGKRRRTKEVENNLCDRTNGKRMENEKNEQSIIIRILWMCLYVCLCVCV